MRKYLPTISELIDRLSIVQLKEVFITEHKEEYAKEIKDIVHDFHQAPHPLQVRTVNGSTTISRKAYFGDYPLPVWYHPEGRVNILPLHNMQKYYQCTMDTSMSNSINDHMLNGSIMKFNATDKNWPYSHQLNPRQYLDGIWNLLVNSSKCSSPVLHNMTEELFPMNPIFKYQYGCQPIQ